MRDVGLLLCRCAPKLVKTNIEPSIDLLVYLVVLCAQLLGCDVLLDGFRLGGGAVLVGATDVECRVAASFAVSSQESDLRADLKLGQWRCRPGEDICREHTSYDITEMGHIVDVWQCAGDEYIPLALHGQNRFGRSHQSVVLADVITCSVFETLSEQTGVWLSEIWKSVDLYGVVVVVVFSESGQLMVPELQSVGGGLQFVAAHSVTAHSTVPP